jgi:hypothetical protein
MASVAEPTGQRWRQLGVDDEFHTVYSAAITTGCPNWVTA